ncbi:MAG: outer membrane lipoprotein-sorting protein [Proteobacteria bacterium]|nr:outer membrane lipoprotein-sorting protein [Pseudomonadota bacterium]
MKVFLILWMLAVTPWGVASVNPTAVVEKGESQMRGISTQMTMTMNINHEAYQRELKLRSWTQGKEKSLVVILTPAKETGVASLRVDNQMWNFFPKTDQTVRVPTSVMLQSWMGSDFTNDDLMKLSSLSTDYTHQLLGTEKLGKEKVYLIECLPKPDAPVVWSKIKYWARVSDSLPVKEEYFDEKGKLVRTLQLSGFKKMDDRIIPTQLRIRNVDSPKDETTVTYEKILFDRKIPAKWFEKETLRNNSQNGLNDSNGWSMESINKANP